jgi:hypothetical protein
MHITINSVSQFLNAFAEAGRKFQFSYEGFEVLYNYIEETDPDYELDVISLCCSTCEDTVENIINNYGIDVVGLDEAEAKEAVLDFLHETTTVVGTTDSGIVYAQF